ncbi:MAG: NAD(P)-dependent oxidoreductase, partial [Spirochaetaceae bacterium]|nr:NAD(P)-dependent oxidoreductase [Spirochaetaceae bacterium]
MDPSKHELGFIGLGVMGASMAGHLLEAGYRVRVATRSPEKAQGIIARGAAWADGPGTIAAACDLVFTMVGYPSDVEEVYFGPSGLIENAASGAYLVDMTTSSPLLARKIYAAAAARGLRALDAPVSGGDVGAKNATLSIMVGGDKDAFDALAPLFALMGKTVVLQGGAGAGQHAKMANQIAIAGCLAGVVESLSYVKSAGLDPRIVLQAINSGSAGSWQLSNNAPRMLDGNFEPGFYVKHYLKDLR